MYMYLNVLHTFVYSCNIYQSSSIGPRPSPARYADTQIQMARFNSPPRIIKSRYISACAFGCGEGLGRGYQSSITNVHVHVCVYIQCTYILYFMSIAREKVALLIGNQKYNSADLDKLTTTENDVRKVAEKLRELRFKVHSTNVYTDVIT